MTDITLIHLPHTPITYWTRYLLLKTPIQKCFFIRNLFRPLSAKKCKSFITGDANIDFTEIV